MSIPGEGEAVNSGPAKALEEALLAMEAGQTGDAADALRRLESLVRRDGKAEDVEPARLWASFRQLLHRRGYFVGTPGETGASLAEISEVGEGFDLYDLAAAIGRFDSTITECLSPGTERRFPELKPFAPRCDCGKHPPGPA